MPTDEQPEQIPAGDQAEKNECQQAQETKKFDIAQFALHVATGIDVNHHTHPGDEDHHHRRQPIHQDDRSEGDRQAGELQDSDAMLNDIVQRQDGGTGGNGQCPDADPSRPLRQSPAEEPDQPGGNQW